MNKKAIKVEYNKKIKLYNEYNKYYYNNSSPKVSDKEFDKLKHDILSLEKKYEFINSEKSPSKTVGYKPSKNFKKVKHRVSMLSLSNAFSEEDLINFERGFEIFDANDPLMIDAARVHWTAYKAAGHALTYWQQMDNGGWKKSRGDDSGN